MKVKDIREGKTYDGRRSGRAHRTVLAIIPYDSVPTTGRLIGKQTHTSELVVKYITSGATTRIVYLWLMKFADWAGAEVGRTPVPKRAAGNAQVLHLTDEVQQDVSMAEGAVAYLVFTPGEHEYKVFTDQSEAVATAFDIAVEAGSGEPWQVYPLYAGAPITG